MKLSMQSSANVVLTRRAEYEAQPAPHVHIARMFDSVDTDQIEVATLGFLNSGCRSDHYTVYRIRDGRREVVAGATVRSPHVLSELAFAHPDCELQSAIDAVTAGGGPVAKVVAPQTMAALEHKQRFIGHRIGARFISCDVRRQEIYALSILRFEDVGPLNPDEFAFAANASEIILSAFAKHSTLYRDGGASSGFSSIATIEEKISAAVPAISKRELQVLARMIYGLSNLGIALDLGIGQESVVTYRKRAYQRLHLGSRHELLHFYLGLL
jgi:DNA-binding CsgD family transcriptional regulator